MNQLTIAELKGHLLRAVALAVEAGNEILTVYQSDFAVEHKEDRSPLTLADRRAHDVIAAGLLPSGLPVLSEEGKLLPYSERRAWEQFWLVDPLDGTKEFIKRNGEFTVNIALVCNGEPVLGVIYVPVSATLYCAARGLGSRVADRFCTNCESFESLLDCTLPLPLKHSQRRFTVVASRSHMSPPTQAFIENLRKRHPDLALVSSGSSLKLCLVARGDADCYPRFAPTMEWDTAAGHAIALESGAQVYQDDLITPLVYNKPDLLNPWFVVSRKAPPL